MDENHRSILDRKQNDCRAECAASTEIHCATQPMNGGISIIVPASNAMPELDRCLASLDRACAGDVPVECILIDDVSQDSTGDIIRSFQKRHEDCTTTIHVLCRTMERSVKSPAYPRNIGMQYARGRYVLFLDADDWLADGAIARMYQRAESWHSDVLLIRMHGEGGRSVPESMFAIDRPQVNPWRSSVMWTLGPIKVFRRSFLQTTNAHFSEAGMPEDIPFTIRALHDAHVVSIAADDKYIHIARRDDNQNLSLGAWDDPDSNEAVYAPLMRTIRGWHYPVQHTVPLLRRLFVRDVFFMLVNAMFSEHDAEDYQRIKVIFRPWYVDEVYQGFAPWLRVILDAAFLGDPSDWQCVSHSLRTEVLQRLDKADTATSDYVSMHKESTTVNGAVTSTAYSAERLRNEVQQSAEAVIASSQWSAGDQMLWCEYSVGSIQRRFEVTHCLSAPVESVSFSISHTEESSIPDERVIHLSGHIRVPMSVQSIRCDFYAHEVHGDGDAVIPAYCERDASACSDDDLLCRYHWHVKVSEQDISASVRRVSISHHERWHLFLRIEGCINGEIFKHSIRLGPHTSLACTHAFLQGWSCADASFDDVQRSGVLTDDDRSSHDNEIKSHARQVTIVPYVSDYGGWCLKRLTFFERGQVTHMQANQTTQKYAQHTNVAYNSTYQASEVDNSSRADQSSTMSAAGGVDNANRS
jgi:glycosyltransferase involved in cell wall biosynthesis